MLMNTCLKTVSSNSINHGQVRAASGETASLPGLAIANRYGSSRRAVLAGREIYGSGEPHQEIYVVMSGWAFQYHMLEDGRRQILDFALPGTVLGFQPERGVGRINAAEALTDVSLAVLPRGKLGEILAREPAAGLLLMNAAVEALDLAYENLTDVGRRTAREAVAHLLLRLFERGRRAGLVHGADNLSFPLRQDHIGDALGLTAVHVCRTLGALRDDGIVKMAKGTLQVLDFSRIAVAAGVECDEAPKLSRRPLRLAS